MWRLLLVPLLLAGCGARPDGPVARALYDDLRTIVATKQRVDWTVDRLELEGSASDVLRSVCQSPPDARRELDGWLDLRIDAEGGPAKDQYARNGGDLDPLGEVLTLERVRAALGYGERHATADCPFWLRPDPAFAGVQSDADRFVLILESMGGPQVAIRGGDATLGGFGVGRLLPAYGVGERLTIALGVEAGAASTFPRNDDAGGRQVKVVAVAGVPLLFRLRYESWRFDLEAAGTVRATRGELGGPRPGVRATTGVLLATKRLASVMPYAGLWFGYEHLPAHGGDDAVRHVVGGTRIGLDWDP
jgi:hypothetical protein